MPFCSFRAWAAVDVTECTSGISNMYYLDYIGTGKSVIGMHLAYIFARVNSSRGNNQCVLYCGPSNKTVDVVHGKYCVVTNSCTMISAVQS